MKKYIVFGLSGIAIAVLLGAGCIKNPTPTTTNTATQVNNSATVNSNVTVKNNNGESVNSNVKVVPAEDADDIDYSAQLLEPVEYCLEDNQPKKLTVPTSQASDWKQYDGNLFSLYYPADFTVGDSLGEDYATFVSPDGQVEFSVFAPYNDTAQPEALLRLDTETTLIEDSLDGPLTCVTELGEAGDITLATMVVQADDKSYLRSIEDVHLIGEGSEVRNTFSIQYDSADSFEQYQTQFMQFMNSLVRYADA